MRVPEVPIPLLLHMQSSDCVCEDAVNGSVRQEVATCK